MQIEKNHVDFSWWPTFWMDLKHQIKSVAEATSLGPGPSRLISFENNLPVSTICEKNEGWFVCLLAAVEFSRLTRKEPLLPPSQGLST